MDADTPQAVSDPPSAAGTDVHLSPRQLEILALVTEGACDGEIALALGISQETVKWYVKEIRFRLGARSRAHAVALAMRQGLLSGRTAPEQPL